ncbi:MAG: hypothetical protein P1U56_16285 [Saprospiraceae bacterium]|nr:hypothetical protein [Saprospiraceae bacterium]
MKKLIIILLTFCTLSVFAQDNPTNGKETDSSYKNRLSFPVFILLNIDDGGKKTNTQHVELHYRRNLNAKDIIGVKFATWRLFQPMGIQYGDGLIDKIESESEYYPGFVRETGIGFTYQRMLWKGLFASVEVLPLYKTYLDENNSKIQNGFKLYTSYHIGYHFSFGKNKRFYIEPNVHCQNWVFDTNTPTEFKTLDDKWDNYFLFEPSIYFGVKF